jgi:hypothetical protein
MAPLLLVLSMWCRRRGFYPKKDDLRPLRSFSLYDSIGQEFYDRKAGVPGIDGQLGLVFLELDKPGENTQGNIMHWLDFFAGRRLSDKAPDYIRKADVLTDVQTLTREERIMIDRLELAREDRKAQLSYARNEGIEQGIEQGIETVARTALQKGLAPDLVTEITGLDRETIKRLQAELDS